MDQIQLQYMRSSVIIPVGRGMIFEEERKQTQHRHTLESSPHNNGTPCLEALAQRGREGERGRDKEEKENDG